MAARGGEIGDFFFGGIQLKVLFLGGGWPPPSPPLWGESAEMSLRGEMLKKKRGRGPRPPAREEAQAVKPDGGLAPPQAPRFGEKALDC